MKKRRFYEMLACGGGRKPTSHKIYSGVKSQIKYTVSNHHLSRYLFISKKISTRFPQAYVKINGFLRCYQHFEYHKIGKITFCCL